VRHCLLAIVLRAIAPTMEQQARLHGTIAAVFDGNSPHTRLVQLHRCGSLAILTHHQVNFIC